MLSSRGQLGNVSHPFLIRCPFNENHIIPGVLASYQSPIRDLLWKHSPGLVSQSHDLTPPEVIQRQIILSKARVQNPIALVLLADCYSKKLGSEPASQGSEPANQASEQQSSCHPTSWLAGWLASRPCWLSLRPG